MEGSTLNNHREAPHSYLIDGDMGRHGGGTLTSHSVEPTLEAYENIFGPSARDIKQDLQRFKRHGRWHLPDILKGPNQYLTDRVDGLITDATNSPFTSRILPYKYITNVDGKIKWNVWSFDEGLSSRVPYESAARVLTQTKRSYAGYFIRQGMAIVLEHNFMMTEAGRENFKRQLNQLVGSIQLTNDLDVHVALILAPSYQKTMNEKYLTNDKSPAQVCREFVELFGFVQKNQNALDILIEEAKSQLKTWGAPMPDFMLCNSKLTFQLTMTPDATNYVTKGPEGVKRLKTGPDLPSYRGIGIVHTRAFSMETGAPPRDMLRRRVRVAEYYRIAPHKENFKRIFQLYNEERDTMEGFTFQDLLKMALCDSDEGSRPAGAGPGLDNNGVIQNVVNSLHLNLSAQKSHTEHLGAVIPADRQTASISGYLIEYFQQQLNKSAKQDFTWTPLEWNEKILFVPGTVDVADWAFLSADFGTIDALPVPDFIKTALQHHFNGATPSNVDRERAKIICQSLAPYHRNFMTKTFMEKITRTACYLSGSRVPKPTNFETDDTNALGTDHTSASGSGSAKIRATYNLYNSLMTRNYLRYGVPRGLLRNPGVDPANSSTFDVALNVPSNLTAINIMNQQLRDRGAWFCPNHFKEPDLVLSSYADFAGYHMLLTKEFVAACVTMKAAPGDHANHANTYLYDIITHPSRHTAVLGAVQTILDAGKGAAVPVGGWTRASLYQNVGLRIKGALETGASAVTPTPFANQQENGLDYVDARPYWFFPRTTDTDKEVFSRNRDRQWKQELWAHNRFKNELCITDALVQEIVNGSGALGVDIESLSGDSINKRVNAPASFPPASNEARNFLCMIAWRLWADQEIALTHVYNIIGMNWPTVIDSVLFPSSTYAYSHPGHGIMMYGDPQALLAPGTSAHDARISQMTENIEVVIVRPNIEHHMLGIILGQGGESLGSTFWGQTELSCYDDSMHGIWGMSYKYHERAIVINERNLIRLWDIAYDGYVGGKDCTAVEWNNPADDPKTNPNSRTCFVQSTTDVTRPYRGASMMVMAFHHGDAKNRASHLDGSTFKNEYKPNWPSPIVFYDRLDRGNEVSAKADFDNIHVVEVEQFRVFNNPLYRNAYRAYRDKMPDFWELHTIRKNAGLAATENEVSSDALAFQGTMRVVSAETGAVIQETLGSGHHGPDFIGVASLRAGKGYRLNSQPTVHRLI